MDKISVIVPVYNVKQYLKRCVKSILGQTYNNLEIILIDDGSTDGSGEICDGFVDKRIKVIHKQNQGLGLTRNVGIDNATGKYMVFVDSDDYIDKTMIENLYKSLLLNSADTCIGGYKRVFRNRVVSNVNPYAGQTFSNSQVVENVLAKMLGKAGKINDHIEMSVWKVLFSTSIIQQNQLYFPSERKFISEDIIFDTEYYSKCQKVCMSNDIGYNYCDNDNSLTTRYNPNRFKLQIALFEELKERTLKLGIYDSVKQRLYNTLIANTRYCIKLIVKFKGRNEALKSIEIILNNLTLKTILLEYSIKENFKSEIINYLIKKKKANLLYLIMLIKNQFNL
ncbi:glycosyltransferase family 2 protein [Limosilactobacillus reuteri]|uniref:glycosyltransferase family 2 protein n=1 Tax=Limosilactobacillus reuteri TaxID=1598 RepID=UPI003993C5CF